MAEARERSEWNRFAVLIAKLHNVNQVKRSGLIGFEDVHPFFIQKPSGRTEPTKEELAMLRSVLGGKGHGKSK